CSSPSWRISARCSSTHWSCGTACSTAWCRGPFTRRAPRPRRTRPIPPGPESSSKQTAEQAAQRPCSGLTSPSGRIGTGVFPHTYREFPNSSGREPDGTIESRSSIRTKQRGRLMDGVGATEAEAIPASNGKAAEAPTPVKPSSIDELIFKQDLNEVHLLI